MITINSLLFPIRCFDAKGVRDQLEKITDFEFKKCDGLGCSLFHQIAKTAVYPKSEHAFTEIFILIVQSARMRGLEHLIYDEDKETRTPFVTAVVGSPLVARIFLKEIPDAVPRDVFTYPYPTLCRSEAGPISIILLAIDAMHEPEDTCTSDSSYQLRELVKELLEMGIKPKSIPYSLGSKWFISPLVVAIGQKDIELMKMLMYYSAELPENACSAAVETGSVAIVKLVLAYALYTERLDRSRSSLIDTLVNGACLIIAISGRNLEMVHLLLAYYIDRKKRRWEAKRTPNGNNIGHNKKRERHISLLCSLDAYLTDPTALEIVRTLTISFPNWMNAYTYVEDLGDVDYGDETLLLNHIIQGAVIRLSDYVKVKHTPPIAEYILSHRLPTLFDLLDFYLLLDEIRSEVLYLSLHIEKRQCVM